MLVACQQQQTTISILAKLLRITQMGKYKNSSATTTTLCHSTLPDQLIRSAGRTASSFPPPPSGAAAAAALYIGEGGGLWHIHLPAGWIRPPVDLKFRPLRAGRQAAADMDAMMTLASSSSGSCGRQSHPSGSTSSLAHVPHSKETGLSISIKIRQDIPLRKVPLRVIISVHEQKLNKDSRGETGP